MIDDDRRGTPLRLGPLAGVVDDVGVDVRQILQHDLRITSDTESRAFAGQPFQIAVLPQVEDRMSPEDVPDPAIKSEIIGWRLQVRAVIDRGRILIKTPRGLNADKDVAQEQTRNGESPRMKLRRSLRVAPAIDNAAARGRRNSLEP